MCIFCICSINLQDPRPPPKKNKNICIYCQSDKGFCFSYFLPRNYAVTHFLKTCIFIFSVVTHSIFRSAVFNYSMSHAIFNCFCLNRMGNCGWFWWLAAMAGSTTDTRHVTRIQVHTVENAKEQFSASVANLQKRRTNYLDLFRSKTSTKAPCQVQVL